MGAGNVKAVFATWQHVVPDPAFRVLVYMALVAQDNDKPPLYWGGREALAMCLGRSTPHSSADWRAVSRAIRQLVDDGAIELDRGPSPVSNARYRVVLLRSTGDAPRHLNSGRVTTPEQVTPGGHNRCHDVTEQVTPHDRSLDARRHPEEEQEPPRLTRGLDERLGAQPSDRARALDAGVA